MLKRLNLILVLFIAFFSFSFSEELKYPQNMGNIYESSNINSLEEGSQDKNYKSLELNKHENKQIENYQQLENKQTFNQDEQEKIEEYEPSNIEKIYNDRLDNTDITLKQYGYEFFKNYKVYEMGSLGDSYVLGPGDTILFYIWGDPIDILKLEGFYSLMVDREGKVYIPNLGVFYVWGLTVKQVKELLYGYFSKKFKNFKIEVSLGKLRYYPVYVSGFVNKPGVVLINATHTVIDALALAGGIGKNGSLRKIVIYRKSGGKELIDLYDLLIYGKPVNIKLKENDSVFVDSIGKTAAIYGSVKRPAIYELKDNEPLSNLINYAGGLLPSTYEYGLKIYRYENNNLHLIDGKYKDEIFLSSTIKDGDLVKASPVYNFKENIIQVKGYVKYPGEYSFDRYKTLSELLNKIGLLPDTNLYYAEIVRLNNDKYEIIKFKPKLIIEGEKNINLKKLDVITLYPNWIFKPIEISGEVEKPVVVNYYPGITILDVLRNVKLKYRPRNLKIEIYEFDNKGQNKEEIESQKIYKKIQTNSELDEKHSYVSDNTDNTEFETREHKVDLEKYKKVIYLYDVLIKNDPNSNIELKEGTKLIIRKVDETEKDKAITILGEVNRPGIYRYESGMKLYDLIVKAGGYTEDAYPKALIFIRESAKKLQQEQLQSSILTMEEELATSSESFAAAGATPQEQALAKIAIEKQKKLLNIIKQKAKIGLGRIALDIPNSLIELKESPDNIELQDGDFIYIPSKPNYILVLGSVYNQISLPYRKNKTVEYYLKEVGGLKDNAKEDDIYIIKANGRVVSKRNFESDFIGWEDNKIVFGEDFYSMKLEQGDTIVVPSEIKVPIMWRPLIKDMTQIIFQALSTAVLAKRL